MRLSPCRVPAPPCRIFALPRQRRATQLSRMMVRAVANDEVLVHVSGKWVRVPWPAVEVTESLPSRWTVVPRPANAVMIPASWGAHYAVCPRCRHRAPLQGRPETMQCPRCGKLSPVAWDEAYLGRK